MPFRFVVLPRVFIFEFARVFEFAFAFELVPVFMLLFTVAAGAGVGERVAFAFAFRAFALFALELVPASPHPSSDAANNRHVPVPRVFLIFSFSPQRLFQPIDGPFGQVHAGDQPQH